MDLKSLENFRDWIPVRCYWLDDRVFVDWCFVGKARLTEPFFDDSIRKRHREPFNLLFRHQTPIEFLGELNKVSEGLKPSGFIFHLSRCGSTLVSRMLAAVDKNIVISEASPLDFVLRKVKNTEKQRVNWVRWMVNALGQRRNQAEEHYFIKFDSWNTLEIGLLKRAFPDVPLVFLYRNPLEIIVSHRNQSGAQVIPGLIPEILPELSFADSVRIPPEEYAARVLGKICQAALGFAENSEILAVNYSELPAAALTKILPHFKISFDRKDLDKMAAAAAFNAKSPLFIFVPDSETKKREANETAIRAAANFVDPFYYALEKLRNRE